MTRTLRYLAPNLVTTIAAAFGLLSMVATHEHRFVTAAWLIIWGVLLDRVDGLVARTLKATSTFGMHMDSFADVINFGVAPAFLMFVTLSGIPELGFATGAGRILLIAACGIWVMANVFRLARFNVVSEDSSAAGGLFFGVPTTLAAGTLVIWYLVALKYSPASATWAGAEAFRGPKLLGDWTFPVSAWGYAPAVMLVGAFLMVSNVPIPKLAKLRWRWLTVFVIANVLAGYACGFARYLPEYMVLMPSSWMVLSLVWGQLSPAARNLRAPPMLPGTEAAADDEDEEDEDADEAPFEEDHLGHQGG